MSTDPTARNLESEAANPSLGPDDLPEGAEWMPQIADEPTRKAILALVDADAPEPEKPCARCGHDKNDHRLNDTLNLSPTDETAPFRCTHGIGVVRLCDCPDFIDPVPVAEPGPEPTLAERIRSALADEGYLVNAAVMSMVVSDLGLVCRDDLPTEQNEDEWELGDPNPTYVPEMYPTIPTVSQVMEAIGFNDHWDIYVGPFGVTLGKRTTTEALTAIGIPPDQEETP